MARERLNSIPAQRRAILTFIQRTRTETKSPTVHITTTPIEVAMKQNSEKSVWIGMAQVLSLPGSELLQDVSGAYVNVLTWASSPTEFYAKAKELMDYLGLKLLSVEDEEPLSEREKRGDLEADIAQVALEVKENPKSIRYMTFHTWKEINA
jgi:hypothetical protein